LCRVLLTFSLKKLGLEVYTNVDLQKCEHKLYIKSQVTRVKCPLGLQYSWPPVDSPSESSSGPQFSPKRVSKDCLSSPNIAIYSNVRNSMANAPSCYCTDPNDADALIGQNRRATSVFDSCSDQA